MKNLHPNTTVKIQHKFGANHHPRQPLTRLESTRVLGFNKPIYPPPSTLLIISKTLHKTLIVLANILSPRAPLIQMRTFFLVMSSWEGAICVTRTQSSHRQLRHPSQGTRHFHSGIRG